jgi:uncharacterized protein (DUF58 family)
MALALDKQLLRKLDRFEIVPRGIHRGGQIGHRRSASRGTGLEFADHKEYSAGDDIRYLDWNLYARLEELFVKIFEQDEALPIYLLLDRSGSMQVGSPSKAAFGARVAAALAYVGLANQDHVRLLLFADGLVAATRTLAGKTRIYELAEFLDGASEGRTDFREAIESFSKETRLPGVAFVLSDFLDPSASLGAGPAGVLEGMRLLVSRKFGVYALHIVAPEEAAPDLSGDSELRDIETGETLSVPLRRDMAQRYQAFFAAHCGALRADLRRYGVHYLRLATDQPLDEVLFSRFPREGVFR